MVIPVSRDALAAFLLSAKRHTYAAQGDDASVPPLLPNSRQLEYREGAFLYRDIYFGFAFFVGQETVYHEGSPLWAMGYAGGLLAPGASHVEAGRVYRFLQAALRQVEAERPYRGPRAWCDGDGAYIYAGESHGDLEAFWGVEMITHAGQPVYRLRYHGGLLR